MQGLKRRVQLSDVLNDKTLRSVTIPPDPVKNYYNGFIHGKLKELYYADLDEKKNEKSIKQLLQERYDSITKTKKKLVESESEEEEEEEEVSEEEVEKPSSSKLDQLEKETTATILGEDPAYFSDTVYLNRMREKRQKIISLFDSADPSIQGIESKPGKDLNDIDDLIFKNNTYIINGVLYIRPIPEYLEQGEDYDAKVFYYLNLPDVTFVPPDKRTKKYVPSGKIVITPEMSNKNLKSLLISYYENIDTIDASKDILRLSDDESETIEYNKVRSKLLTKIHTVFGPIAGPKSQIDFLPKDIRSEYELITAPK